LLYHGGKSASSTDLSEDKLKPGWPIFPIVIIKSLTNS
jgi:hypothetical protein